MWFRTVASRTSPGAPYVLIVMQTNCDDRDMIFSVPRLISFLSQGTTLPPGTVIITGTPPGVGAAKKPPRFLKEGDEFRVSLEPYIGTLITQFKNE